MAQALRDEFGQFRKPSDDEYIVSAWIERDRANLSLSTPAGREIFSLWDDDFSDAIESGYLETPRRPRPTDEDWRECALKYARECGLI